MRWLVTRAEPDGQALAQRLAGLGHDVVLSPVFRRVACPCPPIDCSPFAALIFTSRNGVVMGTAGQDFPPDHTVFAVGNATAEAARAAGFTNVISAQGNVDDLAECIAHHFSDMAPHPKHAFPFRLLHIRGQNHAGSLSEALSAKGIAVEKAIVYKMTAETALNLEARTGLEQGTLDGVILLSPRTATLFAQLLTQAGLSPLPKRFIFAVISSAAAAPLKGLGGRVRTAQQPNLEHVLELLA